MSTATRRLSDAYRSGSAPKSPILASDVDVLAYAAYRMPATSGAAKAAFEQMALVAAEFQPRSMTDLGGGTGAAIWAATQVWPSLTRVTVLDRVSAAMKLGRKLADRAGSSAVRAAEWRSWRSDDGSELPAADLVTMSYLIGELVEAEQDSLVSRAAERARAVVIIEPGTPAGYRRVIRARATLLAAGFSVAAPCPHDRTCPMEGGRDWCHFAARVPRSSLHRQLKTADLSYEDEKYSFVAATRAPSGHARGRIVRHPQYRKGLVSLEVCAADGELRREMVSKKRDEYKRARDVRWGDEWPPAADDV